APPASAKLRSPRVADAPVAYECALGRIVHIGEGPLAANVISGRMLTARGRDETLGCGDKPESAKLDRIERMGGEDYTTTRDRFTIERPDCRSYLFGPLYLFTVTDG